MKSTSLFSTLCDYTLYAKNKCPTKKVFSTTRTHGNSILIICWYYFTGAFPKYFKMEGDGRQPGDNPAGDDAPQQRPLADDEPVRVFNLVERAIELIAYLCWQPKISANYVARELLGLRLV